MAQPNTESRRVRFADFEFDRQTAELRRGGIVVPLPPQPTRVLALLLAKPGELVTRDELRQHLWPDTIVEFDHGLNTCIRQIRDALGERAEEPIYVQTVPRRGYRFVAPVTDVEPDPGAAAGAGLRESSRWWPIGLAVILVIAVVLAHPSAKGAHTGRRLAVLPFDNLSPEQLAPEFVDGLSEELVVELVRYEPADLAVISRASAKRFADSARSLGELANALRVTHVVQGTVRSQGDTVAVTATLVRVDNETAVWSARFSARDLDPMTQMAPLARRMAGSLVGGLVSTEQPTASRWSPSPEATAAFLTGRYLLAKARAADAESHLRHAVELDPNYGLAFALLARARLQRGDIPGAIEAANRAGALDRNLPEVHQALADIAAQAQWDWRRALEEYRQALRLAPGNAHLHQGHAFVLSLVGRHDEAMSEMLLALDLDPVSVTVHGDVAWLFYYARRYEEAAAQARATLALDRGASGAWYCLLLALEGAGKAGEAAPVAADVAERYGASPQVVAAIRGAPPDAALDRFWRWDLDQMRRQGGANRVPLEFAAAFARFHQPDSAFSYIERAVRNRMPFASTVAVDPRFDPLRGDPRLASTVAGLGLPGRAAERM